MNVGIDQSGHQRAAAHIDHLRVLSSQRSAGDFPDQAALDENVLPFRTVGAVAVENSGIVQQYGWHTIPSRCDE